MITPESAANFRKSINLRERQSKKKLTLPDDGVIISEKLATLLNARKGSTISLKNRLEKLTTLKLKEFVKCIWGITSL